ncbi:MAG: hypothetical protein J0G94_19420 [Sphingomonadales bacterium]|nr:hypothetical protein [Sphingomonadales bacterium]
MAIEVQRTIVSPTDNGTAVSLFVSDKRPGDETASFALQIDVQLPEYPKAALLEQVQRDAMKAAQDRLSELLRELMQKIQERS